MDAEQLVSILTPPPGGYPDASPRHNEAMKLAAATITRLTAERDEARVRAERAEGALRRIELNAHTTGRIAIRDEARAALDAARGGWQPFGSGVQIGNLQWPGGDSYQVGASPSPSFPYKLTMPEQREWPEPAPSETPDERQAAIVEAIVKRRKIYADKADKADPLAEDSLNRNEQFRHTEEAFDLLLNEIESGEWRR